MPTAKRMSVFLFFYGTFSLLKEVEGVKGEAESALESFEELQKEVKKSLFVGRALFSLVVCIVSDLNSETCLEITKVMIRR